MSSTIAQRQVIEKEDTVYKKNDKVKFEANKGFENFFTGSLLEIRPMSIDKLQGLRAKVASVDEWLSGDIREEWYHSDDLSRTNYRYVDFSKASEKDFYKKANKLLGGS